MRWFLPWLKDLWHESWGGWIFLLGLASDAVTFFVPQLQALALREIGYALLALGFLWANYSVYCRDQERLQNHRTDESLLDSDPHLYLEIKETPDKTFIKTPFAFINRQGGVAHNVQIEPIRIGSRSLSFAAIPVISQGKSGESIPTADGQTTPFDKNNFFHWVVEEWNTRGTAAGTLPSEDTKIKVIVKYEDSSGRSQFESVTELSFDPIKYVIGSKGDWPIQDETMWAIGAPKFRRLR